MVSKVIFPIADKYLRDELDELDDLDELVEVKAAGGNTNPPTGDWVSFAGMEYGVPSASPTRESAGAGAIGAADLQGTTANADANDTSSSNYADNVILNNAANSGGCSGATNTPVTTNTNANAGAGASTTGQEADNTLNLQQYAVQVSPLPVEGPLLFTRYFL